MCSGNQNKPTRLMSTSTFDDTGTCPHCDRDRLIMFNWGMAQAKEDKRLVRLARHLKHMKCLKFGSLRECDTCSLYWYLDDTESFIHRVPQDRLELLESWNRTRLEIQDHQLELLKTIGFTGPDQYGNGRGRIEVPCAVELQSGEIADPSLLVITKNPPIETRYTRVVLMSEVKTIRESEFALPLKVRLATLAAHEVSMGFAPTTVVAPRRRRFVLNWVTHVFSCRGIKGKDIRLSSVGRDIGESVEQELSTTYVHCDWFEDCESLIVEDL